MSEHTLKIGDDDIEFFREHLINKIKKCDNPTRLIALLVMLNLDDDDIARIAGKIREGGLEKKGGEQ